ncbi:uncharacterized protein BO87DRAFT_205016 [Aspergillus neoniger CBS 115656]|uniref:Uncharacterized protein n=1 Tax=Aspergillus neoniger (strain CBS 115656) TaxID=1448310 RepID=A0A318YS40_ASPNB|nr:hypothetical protein BO87DRAFT_205016 [Aspergillus neoniger CBS 115656]PYH37309.1 hypothetical protein BO87DRAFT_205016 [Aspergillus neoniger CBS 115656]
MFKLSLYFPIWRARAVSSQMASTSSASAVAHPEPTIFAESQTSELDVRTWPPSPPLGLQSSAPGRGLLPDDHFHRYVNIKDLRTDVAYLPSDCTKARGLAAGATADGIVHYLLYPAGAYSCRVARASANHATTGVCQLSHRDFGLIILNISAGTDRSFGSVPLTFQIGSYCS